MMPRAQQGLIADAMRTISLQIDGFVGVRAQAVPDGG